MATVAANVRVRCSTVIMGGGGYPGCAGLSTYGARASIAVDTKVRGCLMRSARVRTLDRVRKRTVRLEHQRERAPRCSRSARCCSWPRAAVVSLGLDLEVGVHRLVAVLLGLASPLGGGGGGVPPSAPCWAWASL